MFIQSYWSTLASIVVLPKRVTAGLDLELDRALIKSRWFSIWTAILAALCFWVVRFQTSSAPLVLLRREHWASSANVPVDVIATVLWIPVFYGLFRLYTLVTHVITLNVFKTRGQRLRLLNLHTSMLPMTVLASLSAVLWSPLHTLALILLLASIAELLWMFALGYNIIFHKHHLHGLFLWIGGTLVTWFVLAICALAATVTVAVLGFFILLFLRIFTSH